MNKVSGQYFNFSSQNLNLKKIQKEVITKTGFQPKKHLYSGKIYDDNKVGTMLFEGKWKNKPAVLKIQLLEHQTEEPELIDAFTSQNKSKIIRVPQIYFYQPWNKSKQYGYYIFEKIEGKKLYPAGQLPSLSNIQEFVKVYAEYHQNCLNKNFVKGGPEIESSLVFTLTRIGHWSNIAQSKNNFPAEVIKALERFYLIAPQILTGQKLQIMHGHFTMHDIHKNTDGKYILFSNAFWSYRPAYYDLAFHLWGTYKDLRNLSIGFADILKNLNTFLNELQKLDFIQNDSLFNKHFHVMLAERSIGALLIDLSSQNYQNDKAKYLKQLNTIFYELLNYSLSIIEN